MTTHTLGERAWRPGETINVNNPSDLRIWAKRLHLTPNELKEMVADVGNRTARVATEAGIPVQSLLP